MVNCMSVETGYKELKKEETPDNAGTVTKRKPRLIGRIYGRGITADINAPLPEV
jgi:hypothetical protein